MNTVQAWHFNTADKRLRYDDNREIALGVTHEVTGEIELCKRGLHASVKPLDALKYAPGPVIWRVELSGNVLTSDDKLCATRRTYIGGGVDVTHTLRLFARKCALDVAHLWDMPDVVRKYLETGDESLKTAARYAARAAAWYAARAAAVDAAVAAAVDAARDAAWYAARAAAVDAAVAAAVDAARDEARAAAWYAARDAAVDAQNERLEAMLIDAIGSVK